MVHEGTVELVQEEPVELSEDGALGAEEAKDQDQDREEVVV